MFFNNPFPASASTSGTIRFSLISGVVVFLILYIFRPFNIDGAANRFTIWHPASYAAATAVMVFLNAKLLPITFTKWYREEDWTLGKEILVMCWHMLTISFVNLLITHWLYGDRLSVANAIKFLFITAAVGIFPVTFILLIKQQLLYQKYSKAASVIDSELQHAEVSAAQEEPPLQREVTLQGDNQGEELTLPVNDILYFSSADNYLRIVFSFAGRSSHRVIRSSLKKAEQMVADHPNLYRCHRTYIVNLSRVRQISGNAQGYKLHLIGCDELIPVSRSLNDEIKERLKQYHLQSR